MDFNNESQRKEKPTVLMSKEIIDEELSLEYSAS